MRPRLLVIDDLFGRQSDDGPNRDRENLCAHFLWKDVTRDAAAAASSLQIKNPIADVVFTRGQAPTLAKVGDIVENDLESAVQAARKGWYGSEKLRSPWSLVLVDLSFSTGEVTEASHRRAPGMACGRDSDNDPSGYFGLAILDALHRRFPELPVIILSSKPREEVSVEFSKRGALGFIARDDPKGPELLRAAIATHGLIPDETSHFIAESLSMRIALRDARRLAKNEEPILILGERGTGKEVLARYLHQIRTEQVNTNTTRRPWVAINSAGLNPNLVPAELFGVEGRAANQVDREGIIESAQGGDIFLDEISDMAPKVQGAIMRVIETKEVTRVGGSKPFPVDVCFIGATQSITASLRPEFLDRLRSGGTVTMPRLVERREDILPLAELFLTEADALDPSNRKHILTDSAKEALIHYSWPGNVRELRSAIYEAVTRNPGVEHLHPSHIRLESESRGYSEVRQVPEKINAHESISPDSEAPFSASEVGKWAGLLPQIEQEHYRLVARYLEAALKATLRRTPLNPEGQVQIHPAMKLATGTQHLSASKAADIIKRCLKPLEGELSGSLLEAYEIACRLRPKSVNK